MLSSHTMKSDVFLEKYDKNGNLIEKRKLDTKNQSDAHIDLNVLENEKVESSTQIPFRSFVKNYITMLSGAFSSVNNESIYYIDSEGISRSSSTIKNMHNIQYNTMIGDYKKGIIVGTNLGGISAISPDSVSFTDYNLKNTISHGISSGTLYYGSSIYERTYISESYTKISYSRIFSNLYTNSININEIGMTNQQSSDRYILLCRDLKDYYGNNINITLTPNQSLYVKYSFMLHTSSLLPNQNWLKTIEMDYDDKGYTTLTTTGFKNFITYRYRPTTSFNSQVFVNGIADSYYELSGDGLVTYMTNSISTYNGDSWLVIEYPYRNSYTVPYLMYHAPYSVKNVDCTCLINTNDTSVYSVGLGSTNTSSYDNYDEFHSIHFNSSSVILKKNISTIITSSYAKTFQNNINYYMRYFASHSVIKGKIWQSGSSEPVDWDVEATSSTLSYGRIGFMSYSSSYKINRINDLNITYLDRTYSYLNENGDDAIVSKNGARYSYMQQIFYCKSSIGNDWSGIVVGSSDRTDSNELIKSNIFSHYDWRLNNQIPHGTIANTIYYGNSEITSSFSGSSAYIQITRDFVNMSNDDINIREVALYLANTITDLSDYRAGGSYRGWEICVGRVSTGPVPVTLSNGESVTFTMKFNFNV